MTHQGIDAGGLQQPGPVLTFVQHEKPAGASFHVVAAQIDWTGGARSQGWGRDVDLQVAQARAGAEAVERHGYATLPAAARCAPANAVECWIHPDALVRYDEQQRSSPQFPYARFSPEAARWWLPAHGVDRVSGANVLADFACSPRAFAPADRARLVTHATSSGCASGSSLGDAIARATLELVERDAFMRHWFAQSAGRAVRSASLPEWCQTRLRGLRQGGCRTGVQSLTLGSHPVLLAWAQHRQRTFTCLGSAAGFDAEAALAGAMNELETQALARLEGVPPQAITPEQVRSPADHAALHATPGFFARADALLSARRPAIGFPQLADACRGAVAVFYEHLRQQGHPVRWVDLSLPQAGNFLAGAPLYTVRALAEGLIPIAFGLQHQAFGMARIAPGGRFPHPFN